MKTPPFFFFWMPRPYRHEWLAMAVVNFGLLAAGLALLSNSLNKQALATWGASAGIILTYQLAHLGTHLMENVPLEPGRAVYPTLGWANWLTMLRAALLALLAGFAFVPRPEGFAVWLPGGLYLAAALMDFLDGYVARVMGRSSRLGEILDMHWDGFGMLVASWLLVRYGQTPVWFLIIGLARYLFLAGMSIRERRGWPNHPMPPSMIRRAMAGSMMGFVAVALLPVFQPPSTTIAAGLFAMPLLYGFIRDWLFVSGVLALPVNGTSGRWFGKAAVPLLARGGVLALLVAVVGQQVARGIPLPGVFWIVLLAIVLISVGAAGRVAALMVVLMTGYVLRTDPGAGLYWALLLSSILLFFTGTGKYSLWKPEEWLIYHRAGETKNLP